MRIERHVLFALAFILAACALPVAAAAGASPTTRPTGRPKDAARLLPRLRDPPPKRATPAPKTASPTTRPDGTGRTASGTAKPPNRPPTIAELGGDFTAHESAHFRIFIQRGVKFETRRIANILERQRTAFVNVLRRALKLHRAKAKMQVVIFRDEENARRYWTRISKVLGDRGIGGVYSPKMATLFCYDVNQRADFVKARLAIEAAIRQSRRTRKVLLLDMDGKTVTPDRARRLLALKTEQRNPNNLAHEATHQLCYALGLFAINQRVLATAGDEKVVMTGVSYSPFWLDEGLASYFADAPRVNWRWDARRGFPNAERLAAAKKIIGRASARPAPGRPGGGPSSRARSLDGLVGIMNLPRFATKNALTEQDVRDMHAGTWSLFHFLMHAENGKYRPRLIRYLASFGTDEAARTIIEGAKFTEDEIARFRRANRGPSGKRLAPGQRALFEKHIGKFSEIEPAWHRYVRTMR